ncbi:uncharacterized protein [Clytia hemisphaerica]|uniref:F-box domain-containing protein n=1 Tax=Clytia hemisphaerica TaxID=252671 RepID=A0A7M5V004_9CNID
MEILSLDEYSILEIFKHLDLDSRRNLSLTCKRFHQANKTILNWDVLEEDLKSQLVDCVCNGHDRDDIPYNFKYQYNVSMVLKYFLQTIDVCNRISKESLLKEDDIVLKDLKLSSVELILKRSFKCETHGLEHLVKIGNSSHIDFNFWYTFNPSPGKFIYLCNCKHPDQKLRRLPFVEDVVMGIIYDEVTDQTKFYMCDITRFDWFYTKPTDSVEFSKEASSLQQICKTLSQFLQLNKKTNKLTPEKLYRMTKLSVESHSDTIFPLLSHDLERTKYKFQHEVEKLNLSQSELVKLVHKLKFFADLCNFQRRDFVQSLIDFVQPIGNTINVFDYGELLAYVPVVKKVLGRASCIKNRENKSELVVIKLEHNVILESTVNFTGSSRYSLDLNGKKLLHFLDGAKDVILSEESVFEISAAFELFVDKNIDQTLLATVPEISLDFVFQLLRCLHSSKVFVLDELKLHTSR